MTIISESQYGDARPDSGTQYTLLSGGQFGGRLDPPYDVDWIRVELSAGHIYKIDILSPSRPPAVKLLDSEGNEVAYGLSSHPNFSDFIFSPIVSGDYYLSIYGTTGYNYSIRLNGNAATSYSYNEIANYLTDGYWEWQGEARRAFDVESGDVLSADITGLDQAGQQLARLALEVWTDVSGIRFNIVDDENAQIIFDDDGEEPVTLSSVNNGVIVSSHITIPADLPVEFGARVESFSFTTYLHEIGHALGLGHPGEFDHLATLDEVYSALNFPRHASVMSFILPADESQIRDGSIRPVTPSSADIIAINNLYGKPDDNNAGDTIYGFQSNIEGYLGQIFSVLTGEENLLHQFYLASHHIPVFADLDDDGDPDLVLGTVRGRIDYYENTGTVGNPVFTQRLDNDNPMYGFRIRGNAEPALADLDGDSDLDLMVVNGFGNVHYFENTGTAAKPNFTERTAAANPMDGINVGSGSRFSSDSSIALTDLDNDGDSDLIIGKEGGDIDYYENTGTITNPGFIQRSGTANPLDDVNVNSNISGRHSSTALVDLDSDGDFDFINIGRDSVNQYFENTGTSANPHFVERTGDDNPLHGINEETYGSSAFADINGDNDPDLIIIDIYDRVKYYENSGTLTDPAFTLKNLKHPIYLTLVDSGGNDTLDLRTDTANQIIDLRPEGISEASGLRVVLIITVDTIIENVIAGSGNDEIIGNSVANRLVGGPGNDSIWGSKGNDVLEGGAGSDRLDGGPGVDWVSYQGSDDGVTVDLEAHRGRSGHAEHDFIHEVENVRGSVHDDELVGDSGVNRLEGADGDDVLRGGSGNDVLEGGPGADELDGGAGIDTAYYQGSNIGVVVRLKENSGEKGHAEGDTFANVENVSGSAYNDGLVGDDGANYLAGGEGNDGLWGGAGDDTLEGGLGADRLFGGDGADWATYQGSAKGVTVRLKEGTGVGGHAEGDAIVEIENVRGSAYNDALVGDDGPNYLAGMGGADSLWGGAGDDTLEGGTGADRLFGGSGADWISYLGSDAGVTVNLGNGTGMSGHAEGDSIVDVEHVRGTGYADLLIGNDMANRLEGHGANDELRGNAGDDMLDGGAGSDLLAGGAGADRLEGGYGEDTASFEHSDAGVTVRLHSGELHEGAAEGDTFAAMVTVEYTDSNGDTQQESVPDIEHLTGSAHDDTLAGDSRANRLEGGAGDDRLYGGPGGGDDALQGGPGADALYGGTGNDVMEGGAGADTLRGGPGTDTASYAYSNTGVVVRLKEGTGEGGHAEGDAILDVENLNGSAYNDSLVGDDEKNHIAGNRGNDGIWGGAGDDTLVGGAGADRLFGGSGTDWASYLMSNAGITVNLGDGTVEGGHAEGDSIADIENIRGSGYADKLVGDEAANHLDGRSGDDDLNGGAGNDILDGGSGADRLSGGSGVDWALYQGSSAGVTVNLVEGTGKGGFAEGDTIADVENVRGSGHADQLVGNDSANRLDGGPGDDQLSGGANADVLNGGTGTDRLEGGAGADTLNGGGGVDWVLYLGSNTGITVNLEVGTGTGGHAEGDTIADVENVWGSAYDDELVGDSGANRLEGAEGDDTLRGGTGNDVLEGGLGVDMLEGGAGADRLNGDDGIDWASYRGSDSGVTVNLLDGTVAGGHATGDVIISIENLEGSDYDDTLTGDGAVNRFIGGDGDDKLRGYGSNDILQGGGGNDVLTGDYGNDRLEGGDGDDFLAGGAGGDTLDGGNGSDLASYFLSDAGVTADLYEGTIEGGHADGDVLVSVEGLQGSRYADELWGDDNDNVLVGSAGDDELYGSGGDDVLVGGYGGNSDSGNDTLAGGAGDDFLHGGGGTDLLHGGEGDDFLYGGWGTDGLHGGEGADTFAFDEFSGDTLITDFTDGVDKIDLTPLELSGFDELTLASTPDGAILQLDTPNEARILFEDFEVANLDASDFIF